MLNWRSAVPIAICLALVVLALTASRPNQEPYYLGKPLTYWISLYLDTNASDSWARGPQEELASRAVQHMATNAIPFLVRWLQYDGTARRNRLNALPMPLPRLKIVQRLCVDPNKELRAVLAAKALESLGPQASPAFPALGQMLTDGQTFGPGNLALWVLGQIGQPAVPTLAIAATNQQAAFHRSSILRTLNLLGTNAVAAVPTLTVLLQDTNAAVRRQAADTIEAIMAGLPKASQRPSDTQ